MMMMSPSYTAVYPRVCGGSFIPVELIWKINGLSPRVRGKHPALRPDIDDDRSIPACAGEAGFFGSGRRLGEVYPRVCGGSQQIARILV